MNETLKKQLDKILLDGRESLSIEFKREWHWTKKNEDKNNVQWNKFLRNFSGLINTTEEDFIPIKYFIIGYDEKTQNTYDYKIDKYGNKLLYFQEKKLIDVKKEIIKKLKNIFDIVNYGEESFAQEDFEDLLDKKITITTHEYKHKELLIFIIEPLPFLLALKENKNLETIKEKEIPYRKIKNGEPGVLSLDNKQEKIVKELIVKEWNKYKLHSPKNSIRVIVDAYNTSFYKKGKIINYKIDIAYSNSNFYEMIGLEHRDKKEILFIYFSKYTSIKKIFEEILDNHLELNEYTEIFLILENTHEINSGRFKIAEHPKVYEIDDSSVILLKGKKRIDFFSPIFNFIDKKNYQNIRDDLEDENFFFSGNITSFFIEPFIEESDKKVQDSLNLWKNEKLSPIKFIIGEGGIGKTTVVKNFAKSIIKSDDKQDILFINAKSLIDNISTVQINSLYSFVKLFIEQGGIDSEELLNESMFNILLDSGKFLIIIDGLDEAMVNSKEFDSVSFIESIYKNCLDNLGKTKILCTIRSDFWENKFQVTNIGKKIEKLTLKGFNIELAENFFKEKSNGDKLRTKQAMTKMKIVLGEKEEYIPSHLEMVSDILEQNIPKKLKSNLLSRNIDIDSLIYAMCDRETVKFEKDLETVDEQLPIFIDMSILYSGECTEKQFKELTGAKYEVYMSHPLLNTVGEDTNKKYELKYDSLKEDFTELFFLKLVKEILDEDESIEKLLENREIILKLNISNLKKRAKYILDIEKMKYLFLLLFEFIDNMNEIETINRELISFLFSLTLNLLDKEDKPNHTDVLKDLFQNPKDKTLYYVSFFNSKFVNKKLFNFKGLKFYDAYIDYKYFGDCDFNSNTYFEKSKILGIGYKNKCNFKKENFSNNCDLSEEIKILMDERESKLSNEKDEVVKSINKILNKLYKNNFISVKKERVKNKLKGLEIKILNFLIKEKIIIEDKSASRDKRNDDFLEISATYQPLLEELLEGQKSMNSTLEEIVNKFG